MTIETTEIQRQSIDEIQRILWKLKPGVKIVASPFGTYMIFKSLYIEDNTIKVELSYDGFPEFKNDYCLLEDIHKIII